MKPTKLPIKKAVKKETKAAPAKKEIKKVIKKVFNKDNMLHDEVIVNRDSLKVKTVNSEAKPSVEFEKSTVEYQSLLNTLNALTKKLNPSFTTNKVSKEELIINSFDKLKSLNSLNNQLRHVVNELSRLI